MGMQLQSCMGRSSTGGGRERGDAPIIPNILAHLHRQVLDMKAIMDAGDGAVTSDLGVDEGIADEVNRWDLLNRGRDDD